MDFTDFPLEIIFIIFEKLLESEDYIYDEYEINDDWQELDDRSYFKEYNFREYDFDTYNAYQLSSLSLLNKKYYKTFNSDIYWEQILQYKNIVLPKKNNKKKYIQSIIWPYFKKIDGYYKCKLLEENTCLKIEDKNIEYIDDLLGSADENEYGQFMINMKGFWTQTLKNKIPNKSNNWMTMTFETRGYPRNKSYGWVRGISRTLKCKYLKNIRYYKNEIELSKKRFKSCKLYLNR